ncbi:lecithin retinol acyltransferase family protein [Flectobacillus roseus]|uniref:Lecithin retinol acyltransferase family protein n=1 Tax=Flectobacillus roseus TaxID=502259 RepID=A0ABT6Y6Y5_9BACT|nr:lecithin retinol acyltransferase family protein [Flectobacillus roseus]MDI9859337.1 lecithin retinol acyltransferase family protein [Flectobacillus roseus]
MFLINHYGIQLGDKVSRLKRGVPFIRHYAVYLGANEQGIHRFAENNVNNGVQIVTADDFFSNAEAIQVDRTNTNWEQRMRAVRLAEQKVGQKYNLLDYNCEHFANEVTIGHRRSKQVSWGLGISAFLIVGVASTLISKR